MVIMRVKNECDPFSLDLKVQHQIQNTNKTLVLSERISAQKNPTLAQFTPMEIPEKVLKFRYHFLGALLLVLTLITLILMAPRFMTLLAYFWPLFLSTALVLALVFFFAKTSPLPSTDATSLHTAGQGLLDYVAGHHEPPLDSLHKSD